MAAKAKVLSAKSIKVGDKIETTNGMREVLRVNRYRALDVLSLIQVAVQCPASPPQWEAEIRFKPTDKVKVVRA
jgi:hypothetical protein